MKINKIAFKNFKGIAECEVIINGKSSYLLGANGEGKTTVIDAILMAIKGTIQKSNGKPLLKKDRFLLVGEYGKESNLELILKDEKTNQEIIINRVFDAKKNELTIKSSTGEMLNEGFLTDLLSEFSINPVNFLSKTPQEQAILLGINTMEFDIKIKKGNEELSVRNINKLNKMKAVTLAGKVERAEYKDDKEISKTLSKLSVQESNNRKLEIVNNRIIETKESLSKIPVLSYIDTKEIKAKLEKSKINENIERERTNITNEIKQLELRISELKNKLQMYPEVEKLQSSEEIALQISKAENNNTELGYAENNKTVLTSTLKSLELEAKELQPEIVITKTREELEQELQEVEENNRNAEKYANYKKLVKEKEDAENYWREQKDVIDAIEKQKASYLSTLELPLPELGIDENGGLTYNRKEIDEINFNHAKMVEIAIALLTYSSPKLKTIFVKDGNLYDQSTIEKLEKKGFQMIYEYVDSPRPTENLIMLKEVVR